MKEEHSESLRKNYPLLYRNGICFECEDGWYELIDRLSNRLERILQQYKEKYPNEDHEFYSYATQVKEKFGTLRYYMSFGSYELFKAIDEAETESEHTCERCGSTEGKLRSGGWIIVRCDKCFT